MTWRFRWNCPFADAAVTSSGDDAVAPSEDAAVTVTRVAGEHDFADDRQRRYSLDVPAGFGDVGVTAPPDCECARSDGLRVAVPDGAGLATVRVRAGECRTRVRLPGPGFHDDVAAAVDGDEAAARAVLDSFASAVEVPFACGPFLDADGVAALVDALAGASDRASDALHAARYDIVRTAATTAVGPRVDGADAFEALVEGLDAVDAIGDVDAVDALADAVAVAHDSPGETRAFLAALGYDPAALAERGDGRFSAHYLAQVARTTGVPDARQQAARRAADTDHEAFGDAKAAAERADYWDRGAAWRDAVLPAAGESLEAFAYVLANALYWTGEVGRSDSRADELLHEGAAAAAATIDLDWVAGRATFERHRAAGHRHRSSRNHALALERFERAREVADAYSFLDPWEPTYSRAVVRSNRLSTVGDHERAVDVLDDALDALREQDVPGERFAEMRDHLVGQRHERRAILADGPGDRLAHLEAALDRYERVGFERSVARIEGKLDDARTGAADDGAATDAPGRARPQPIPRSERGAGPDLADVPELHDFLVEADPGAVGSADPGVLPDERGDDPGAPGRDAGRGPGYR